MAGPLAITCSWCGAVVQEGRAPVSHGLCSRCLDERSPARLALEVIGALAFIPVLFFVLALVLP